MVYQTFLSSSTKPTLERGISLSGDVIESVLHNLDELEEYKPKEDYGIRSRISIAPKHIRAQWTHADKNKALRLKMERSLLLRTPPATAWAKQERKRRDPEWPHWSHHHNSVFALARPDYTAFVRRGLMAVRGIPMPENLDRKMSRVPVLSQVDPSDGAAAPDVKPTDSRMSQLVRSFNKNITSEHIKPRPLPKQRKHHKLSERQWVDLNRFWRHIEHNHYSRRQAFTVFDKDQSGSISFNEFIKGCQQLGMPNSQTEFRHVFNILDLDHSGHIDEVEFLGTNLIPPQLTEDERNEKEQNKLEQLGEDMIANDDCLKRAKKTDWKIMQLYQKLMAKHNNMKASFEWMDGNGNGVVSRLEFDQAINVLQLGFSQEEIKHMFDVFDMDNSGKINLEEFSLGVYQPKAITKSMADPTQKFRENYSHMDINYKLRERDLDVVYGGVDGPPRWDNTSGMNFIDTSGPEYQPDAVVKREREERKKKMDAFQARRIAPGRSTFKSTGQPRVARDGRAMVRQTFMCPSKVMPKQDMLSMGSAMEDFEVSKDRIKDEFHPY